MKIFAVIVTYNAMRNAWIEKCLRSLEDSTQPVTPIVVDNGSTDQTCTFVSQHFCKAIWLPQDQNLGFGQANNVGIKYALEHDADYVLLLNQDATLHPKALENLVKASDGRSLLSPLQLNGDGTRLDALFKYVLLRADHLLYDDLLIKHSLNPTYTSGKYAAACWLMPARLIRQIGGFNPLFFQYSEDYNYLDRLSYHGIEVQLVPSAMMYHDREIHGNNKVFSKKRLRRDMLLAACNINLSVPKVLKEWLRILWQQYAWYIPKREYIPGTFFLQTFWFMAHIGKISRSRKKEKQRGPCWLKLKDSDR